MNFTLGLDLQLDYSKSSIFIRPILISDIFLSFFVGEELSGYNFELAVVEDRFYRIFSLRLE